MLTKTQRTSTEISHPLRIAALLKWIVFFAFFIYAFAFIEHSIRHIFYPWASDYVEMPELSRAIALSAGENIYTTWDSPPYREANYTPVYTIFNALLIAFWGPSLIWGRLISFVAVALTAYLMIDILSKLKVPRLYAIFSALLFCSGHVIWIWASLVRVDNLAVLFQISAIWVYLNYCTDIPKENPSGFGTHKKALMWCIVLLVGAAFTRQTMVAAAVAIIVSLLKKNKAVAVKFTISYALIGLFCGVLLLAATSGLAWQHLVSANVNEFESSALWFFIGRFWDLYHWMIPLCLTGLYAMRHSIVLVVYFMAALGVSITIGKIGASLNYVIELWAAVCLLTAAGLWKWNTVLDQKWLTFTSPASWLLLLIGWQQIFHVPYNRQLDPNNKVVKTPLSHYSAAMHINNWLPLHHLDPFGADPETLKRRAFSEYWPSPGQLKDSQMKSIEKELKGIEKPILSEDMNFTLSLNKDIWIQPFEFTQLERQGLWESETWQKTIENHGFGAIVLMFDLVAPIPSPVDATVLSAPPEKMAKFEKHSALFQLQANTGTGPLRVPWSGTILSVEVQTGQTVKKNDVLAMTAPDISGLASSQRFPKAILKAMRAHYVLHKRIGPYRIYVPDQH